MRMTGVWVLLSCVSKVLVALPGGLVDVHRFQLGVVFSPDWLNLMGIAASRVTSFFF